MMNSSTTFQNDLLRRLVKVFYKGSLQFSLQPKEVEFLTWEQQQKFLDATVNSERVKKYPVNSDFARLFFKKLLMYLEPRQEVHDDIYCYLCSLMEKDRENESFYYRHYVIGEDLKNVIIIKETKNMVVNGTTGMKTWEAALMLADWVLSNEALFRNKKILELGSGVGFTGITIAKHCKINSILLTDCHEDVLNAICDNIAFNFPQNSLTEGSMKKEFTDGNKVLGVMMLDWDNVQNLSNDLLPDVIIGSDIIYDPSILKPLCNVIKIFTSRNKSIEIYVANIIRNEDTYKQFLRTLDVFELDHEEISHTKNASVEWDVNIHKYTIIRIKDKQ